MREKLNEDSIEQIFLRAFPDIKIFIVRGFDEYSETAYTHSAYFVRGEAETVIRNIPSNGDGDLTDTYHLITTNFDRLYHSKVYDQRTEKRLDNIDISLVYRSLCDRLKE